MKKIYILIGILLLVVFAIFFLGNKASQNYQLGSGQISGQQSSNGSTPTSSIQTPTSSVSASYIIHANDSGADLTKILALKGDLIQVTFVVNSTGTSHGGIDFRSSIGGTGSLAPGLSKTIVFTANESFAFNPYWPSTNEQAPYRVTVSVGIP